jgi:ADP-ribose pyrophosphatase YjhB (NUDIX family)
MGTKNSHCSYCGHPFAEEAPWPRQCTGCGKKTYLNPMPVSVVLVPVDGGLLVVRRAIEPRKGLLALPGGFIGLGESWQEAGAREVAEETGLRLDPATIRDFCALSSPDGHVLIFGLVPPIPALPTFTPNAETLELAVLPGPAELAFPLHTAAAAAYFERVKRET